ncbi:sulfur carrier protein ThiS [Novipirellula artificiosorum]|uniref:Sulfur carrier protein ThiS n=1 Tax=Novipirellula artificiosorum TaxID=2528016 RepID=A0A5C6DGY0_9BACT|nr:sulfur carrier protein ThiS [Novipirellula artificiosorum]TWU35001.1 Sulfur carrier protein ThiS [Novipirellula artificiosorum]
MISITVNGQQVQIESSMSVQQMLDTVDVPPNYLAVEINANVVPREQYASTMVRDNDEIELVTLVGGG